jgi:putative redox protein
MTAQIIYQGGLRCLATHLQSSSIIETDAPTDNRGKGERFSPTDLVCVALATCIVTTMGMKANDMNIDISQTQIAVTKHMKSEPRRIGQIDVTLRLPADGTTEKDRQILERVGSHCPVHQSLHAGLVMNIVYEWVAPEVNK